MKLPVAMSLLLLITALGWTACDGEENYLDRANCNGIDADLNTYNLRIKDILNTSCALSGCHDAATQSNGHNLSTYTGARAVFESGPGLCAIYHGEDCEPMPKGGTKLNNATLDFIACWAKNGYKE